MNTYNKSLQLTNNTPLRSVLWSTEFKRYIAENNIVFWQLH